MLIPLVCITPLYPAASVLPALGLAQPLRPIRAAEQARAESGLPANDEVARVADLSAMMSNLKPRARPGSFRIDRTIVLHRRASGAAASIWALWLCV